MFPAMVLIAWRPPSLRRVPASPVPRPLRYYEAATTSRRACPSAYVFASGFRPGSSFVFAVGLPAMFEPTAGPGASFTGAPGSRAFPYGRRRTSQVPWRRPRPCPALRPRPNRSRLAMSSRSMLPPYRHGEGFGAFMISKAATGLQRPLSTLHERRCRRPAILRLPAGGLRLCREGVEPSGSLRKVSNHIHPPFQGLP